MGKFLDIFDVEYGPKLGKREETFRLVFEVLEKKKKDFYVIVETGCIRKQNNWEGDGYSTVLFDRFVNVYDGIVYSVDINDEHCQLARYFASDKSTVVTGDSVRFLWELELEHKIDLLYLDSYDISSEDVHDSALHHFMELQAARNNLASDSLIVADDCDRTDYGKGRYIKQFMDHVENEAVIEGCQLGWFLNGKKVKNNT